MRTPAVLYAAKSTQDRHASIPDQLGDGRKKAADEGWEVVGEFKDEKFSAYTGNRGPGLKAATDLAASVAAERGTVCMLVAQHSDRFARGAGDKPGASDSLIEIWHRMRRADVHLRTKQNDPMMERPVTVAVASEQAYEESKRKSEAVKDGKRRRAQKGLPIGSTDPLGYRMSPDGYEPVSAEVPTVERIFRDLHAGMPQLRLARELNRDGVPSKAGGSWYQGTIRRVARNPIYKGMILHHGESLPGTHKPIIAPALWDEVNDQLDLQAERAGAKGRGRPTIGRHLFRKGMLRCKCGALMLPRTTRKTLKGGREQLYEVYVCSERVRDSQSCSMTPVQRAAVDGSVFRYFEQVGLDVDSTRDQLASAVNARVSEAAALLEQARSDQHRTEEQLARIRRDYTEGKLSAEDWTDFKGELGGSLDASAAQAERFSAQLAEAEAMGSLNDAESVLVEGLAKLRESMAGAVSERSETEAVRAALTRLFDRFELRAPLPGEPAHVDLLQRGTPLVIVPIPRKQAIEGYTDSMLPVLRREPLQLDANKYAPAFAAA